MKFHKHKVTVRGYLAILQYLLFSTLHDFCIWLSTKTYNKYSKSSAIITAMILDNEIIPNYYEDK